MRILVLGLVAAACLASSAHAEATAEQRALSARYIKVMRLAENMNANVKTSAPQMLDALSKSIGMPEAMKPMMLEILDESMAEMTPKLFAAMEAAAAETYTEQELSAVIQFYESPIGQAMLDKSKAYAERMTPTVTKIMVEYQQSIMKRTVEKLCADDGCKAKPPLPKSGPS